VSPIIITSFAVRQAKYCDDRVCLCVCLSVCPRTYLRYYTSDIRQIFMHITYVPGSVLLRRRCGALNMDNVICICNYDVLCAAFGVRA